MRKTQFGFLIVALMLLVSNSWAGYIPEPETLPELVSKSEVIAILRVDSVSLKELRPPTPSGFIKAKDGTLMPFYTGPAPKPEGAVNFTVMKSIKGGTAVNSEVNMPSLTLAGYSAASNAKTGSLVVAFLRRDVNGWEPQDPLRPFLPIAINQDLTSISTEDPLQQVESLILPELKNDATRQMAADLLSNSFSQTVVVALTSYIEDPDLNVKDYVLTALARNKQVAAINRIRDLNRLTSERDSNPKSITELRSFSGMKEALPWLNPLLFEDEQFIRVNALGTLGRPQDSSSIPFLLLTLYDPEYQKMNAPKAYAIFSHLSGAKLSVGAGDFALHPEEARKEAWSWWRDELAGKHPHKEDDKDAVVLTLGQIYQAKDLPQLNEALFMRSEFTRTTAIQALGKLADQSSLPYLIIALRDPQTDVAYSAHRILARLVPALGPVQARTNFNTNRDQIAEAGAKWWSKHLQDAEEERRTKYIRSIEELSTKPTPAK